MLRWILIRRILHYRAVNKKLKEDKQKLQHAIERLEHQLRLARLEEKRLKEKFVIKDSLNTRK